MRGLQWWHSTSWAVGDPDALVWTTLRAVRRARAVRASTFAFVLAMAAVAGAVAGFAFMK